jgi:hypothetical protein
MHKKFHKPEIYNCHYEISGCHNNQLSTVNTLHGRESSFYVSVLWLFCENLYNVDVNKGIAVHTIKETVYEWLIGCVVRGG